jgi:hypothetical protein
MLFSRIGRASQMAVQIDQLDLPLAVLELPHIVWIEFRLDPDALESSARST